MTEPIDSTPIEGALPSLPQVLLERKDGQLFLYLPPDRIAWEEVLLQLQQRLLGSDPLGEKEAKVTVVAADRFIDLPQLEDLRKTLHAQDLSLGLVMTTNRQTAIAAATAGLSLHQNPIVPLAPVTPAPLYLKTIVRSGMEIYHPGSVILWGDVHPGGEIIAEGDILVFGKLKGKAHAGAKGNGQAIIMALQLEPLQIQIAAVIARVEPSREEFYPEVAYLSRKGALSICIAPALDQNTLSTLRGKDASTLY